MVRWPVRNSREFPTDDADPSVLSPHGDARSGARRLPRHRVLPFREQSRFAACGLWGRWHRARLRQNLSSLGLTGEETSSIRGLATAGTPPREVRVIADGPAGSTRFTTLVRLDTPTEADYYRLPCAPCYLPDRCLHAALPFGPGTGPRMDHG